MKFDLHTHSTASDGHNSPAELVQLAANASLELLSLTDHDTVGGIEEAASEATKLGIRFLPGIEFSAKFYKGQMHILGYNIDPKRKELLQEIKSTGQFRENRNKEMIRKLKILNYDIDYDDIRASIPEDTVMGSPHIAKTLLDKKYVKSFQDAYDSLLGFGQPAYVEMEMLTPENILRLIHEAGGIAFLAHPITLGLEVDELEKELLNLKDFGLDGIEIFNSCQNSSYSNKLIRLAEKLEFMKSGGSDFHGRTDSTVKLGHSYGPRKLKRESLSDELFNLV